MHRSIALALAALFVVGTIFPTFARAGDASQAEERARVTATSLNIRSAASTQGAVLASAAKGTLLVVLDRQAEWVQVRLEDGTTGWAAAKYLETVATESRPAVSSPLKETPSAPRDHSARQSLEKQGGGSAIGAVAKWGCLLGGVALGGLAISEHSQGNKSYDDYKTTFNARGAVAAESAYTEAKDHDKKAMTYGIVAGGLGALWFLQRFILGGGGDDNVAAAASVPPGRANVTWNAADGQVRAAVLLARF